MAFTIPNQTDASHFHQAEVDSGDIDILVEGFNGDGVIGTGLAVTTASCALKVNISAGTAIINGARVVLGSGTCTTHATADSCNPRFDLVTLTCGGSIARVAGTAAARPVFPAVPAGSAVLATVYIPAGDTAIAANQITDKRVNVENIAAAGTGDDILMRLGADGDISIVHRASAIAACAEVANITEGTSLHPGVAVNSLVVSNTTDNGDMMFVVSDGGHSRGLLKLCGANGRTIFHSGDVVVSGTQKLYFNDAGGEYLSGDGSTLTITGAVAATGLVSTGALNAGSITCGFGTIDTGSSAITTTGLISGGSLDIDCVVVDGKVVTMTGSACDTVVMTAATHGAFSLVTTDTAGGAANIQITADGTVDIDSAGVLTLDSGAAINIEPAACSAILLDGTISVDAGVVTGATSITSTAFVGAIDGAVGGNTPAAIAGTTIDASTDFTIGTTVITDDVITFTPTTNDTVVMTATTHGAFSLVTTDTAAAAANIVITADGTVDVNSAGVLTLDSGAAINIEPAACSAILLDGTISVDAGVVTGATSVTSTHYVTGNNGTVKFLDGDGNKYFTLAAHACTTACIAYTFPACGGSCGNVLATNGSGVLSWASDSGARSVAGTTDNALVSFVNSGSTFAAEANLTFTGSALTLIGTATVGVDGTGHDVKFFGCAAGAFMHWDESANLLEIRGATAAGPGHLKLTTGEATVVANDVLGKIEFQAPAECGTDAVKVSATIAAVAQGTFAACVNATDLILYTAHDCGVAERFRFTSQGEIGIAGANYGDDGQVLTSTGGGTAVAWEDAASGGLNSCADAIIHNGYGIVIGHTGVLASGDHPADTVGEFTMIGAAGGDTGIHILRHSADAGGGAIRFAKSRNATVASHTVVQACDTLGEISWFGCDSGDFQPFAATIKVLVDGTPGTGDMPGRMEFSTTPNGAEATTLAMKISNDQKITVKCGSGTPEIGSGLVKTWGGMNGAGTITACGNCDYNVTSTGKCATGVFTITSDQDFGSQNEQAWGGMAESGTGIFMDFATPAVGTIVIYMFTHAGAASNTANRFWGFGRQ
jgi:hypothetical protein